MAKKILSLVLALAMVSSFACISAFAADECMKFDGVTEKITLDREYFVDDEQCAILAMNDAELTIDATEDGAVIAGLNEEDGLSIAVWAHDANVVINGGYYENTPDNLVDPSHVDLIYASKGANITINGGTFKCATPRWTLNCYNGSGSTITVKGGKFYQFDPANAQTDGVNEIVVPEGYTVVKEGDWYKVVKEETKVYEGVTEEITLDRKYFVDDEQCAILAMNGADLTINATGNGAVIAGLNKEDGLSIAVWAHDANVVINGGYYENTPDEDVDPSHVDLIYASKGANITINGGTFKCATPRWTLNCYNGSGSTITVKGGKFYQFDPANAQTDGVNEIVVPEGYTVVKEGDWYKVVKEEAKVKFDSVASAIDEDGKGAIRFVFNATLPEATETYFGAYMLPLSVFTKSGVANAVRVQYAKTEVDASTSFSADLVKIPASFFTTSIYAIPYIRTANGIATFAGASASVNSALAE